MIAVKRAYEPAGPDDGARYLVDRVWPRGVSRTGLQIEAWDKDAAPSNTLRKWFGHDPARWAEFQKRYDRELDAHPEAWEPLVKAARRGRITLVYGARDTEHNQAVALKHYLDRRLKRKRA